MTISYSATDQSVSTSIATNKVLKNTYLLLSATLCFSAVVATFSALWSLPHPGLLLTLVGYFGLLYLTNKYRNSGKGLACVFALTGFMGYTLGPMIETYWSLAPNIVVQAMAATAIVFTAMSLIAVRLKHDLSNLAKTLFRRHSGCLSGGNRGDSLRNTRTIARRIGHVCGADVGHDSVPNQSDY